MKRAAKLFHSVPAKNARFTYYCFAAIALCQKCITCDKLDRSLPVSSSCVFVVFALVNGPVSHSPPHTPQRTYSPTLGDSLHLLVFAIMACLLLLGLIVVAIVALGLVLYGMSKLDCDLELWLAEKLGRKIGEYCVCQFVVPSNVTRHFHSRHLEGKGGLDHRRFVRHWRALGLRMCIHWRKAGPLRNQ